MRSVKQLAAVALLALLMPGLPASAADAGAPTNVTVADSSAAGAQPDAAAVKVSWQKADGAVAYYISYTSASSPTSTKTALADQTSIIIDALNGGIPYDFVVKAKLISGTELAADKVTFSPKSIPTKPVVDQIADAPIAGKNQVTLSWKAPTNDGGSPITGYTISDGSKTTAVAGTSLTTTIGSLTSGQLYSFTITATNSKGTSAAASYPSVKVPDVPAAPESVTATVAQSSDNITVSWTAPAGTVKSYSVYLYAKATNAVVETQTGVTGVTHQFTGVAAGTYYAKVRATNDIGDSALSAASADAIVAQKQLTANDPVVTPNPLTDIVIDASLSISVTVPSGDTPTLKTSPDAVCSLINNSGNYSIKGLAAGTCTLEVSVPASGVYAAGLTTLSLTVKKKPRTVTNSTSTTSIRIGETVTASGSTAPAGGTIVWSSRTTSVCTVSGAVVTAVTAGTCTVRADVAEDSTYAAATPADKSFTVLKKLRSVVISAPVADSTLRISDTTTATATTTPLGGTVSWSTSTAATCSVNATTGVITGLGTGTCTIVASVIGDDTYLDATPSSRSITITKRSRTTTISAPAASSTLLMGDTVTASAATSPLGGSIVWSSTTSSVCTVNASSGVVTPVTAGSCSISATADATSVYDASGDTVTITVAKKSRTVAVLLESLAIGVGHTDTGTAKINNVLVASNSVTWTSSNTGVCTVASTGIITGVAAGTCRITATAAATDTYLVASATTDSITVSLNTRTVTVSAPQGFTALASTESVTVTVAAGDASSIADGLVTWSTTTSDSCTVTGVTATTARVTGVLPGTCHVTATVAADGTYAAASNGIDLSVVKKSRGVSIVLSAASVTLGAGTVSASIQLTLGDTATSTVTWSASPASACTISAAGLVTPVAAGTCTVDVTVADPQYLDATASQQLTVNAAAPVGGGGGGGGGFVLPAKAAVTITIDALTDLVVGKTAAVTAKASSSAAVTFTVEPSSVCSVSGSTVTAVGAGICTVKAATVEDATHLAGTASLAFNVVKAPQTITFDAVATQTAPGSVALHAASSANGTVTFTATGDCTVTGSTASFTKPGSCTVTAHAVATAALLAASDVSQTFLISEPAKPKTEVKITISAAGIAVGASTSVAVSATDGVVVTLSAGPSAVCAIASATLSAVAAGACTITATYLGDATHLPASASTTVTVSKRPQTVSLAAIPDAKAPGSVQVQATSSAGLAVTLAASGVCSLSGTTLSFSAAGSCTVTATASGDATYLDAPSASQSFAITVPVVTPTPAATTVKVTVAATAPIAVAPAGIKTTATTLAGATATVAIKAGTAAAVSLATVAKGTKVTITVKDASGKTITTSTSTTAKAGTVALPALKFKSAGTYKIVAVVAGKTRTLTVKVAK